jgi:hypothetical protein
MPRVAWDDGTVFKTVLNCPVSHTCSARAAPQMMEIVGSVNTATTAGEEALNPLLRYPSWRTRSERDDAGMFCYTYLWSTLSYFYSLYNSLFQTGHERMGQSLQRLLYDLLGRLA